MINSYWFLSSPAWNSKISNHFGWTRMIQLGMSHCKLLLANECPFELVSYKQLLSFKS